MPPATRALMTDSQRCHSGVSMNLNVSSDWRMGAGIGTPGRDRGEYTNVVETCLTLEELSALTDLSYASSPTDPLPMRRSCDVLLLTTVTLTLYSVVALNPGTPDRWTSCVGGSG